MTNEEIELLLKKLNCTIYKLNHDTKIIENKQSGGGSTAHAVKEIVDITTALTDQGIRFIIDGDSDIQIE